MRHSVDNLNKPSMKIAAIICVLIIVMVCYFVFFKKNGEMKGPRTASEPVVEVMQVEKRDMMRHVVLSGKTVADANIALAPKYNGRVVKVNANLGDFVHEGDILLVQDTGDLDLSILQQEANTNAATADVTTQEANFHSDYILAERNYNIVEKDYERQKYLYSIGAISQGDLEDNEQIYLAAKAKLEALENQNNSSVLSKQYAAEKSQHATEALRKQRDDMILRAPRDGIIGYRNAEVGSYLNAGSKVFSLVDNSHVFVDCSISENDAAVLENGMNVNVTIDALGKNFTGKLIYVSPAMDETSKTYTARIELDIDKNTLTENQLRDINDWFDNKKLNICIESFLDEPNEDDYNREAYYTYSKSFELSNHPIDLKGWMCVDKYGFMLDGETGEIKQRCENPGISYGNILENLYDFSKKCYPVQCNRNFCLLCMHGQTMNKIQ